MDDSNRINPGHSTMRGMLRVIGPLILLVGLGFTVVGMASFFSAFGGFEPPRYFWCVFVGMPLMFVGLVLTAAGFLGAVARYQAAEMAPVGKDTINYTAAGIKPAIRDVTEAVVQGINSSGGRQPCARCGASNDRDASFCKSCGQKLMA